MLLLAHLKKKKKKKERNYGSNGSILHKLSTGAFGKEK